MSARRVLIALPFALAAALGRADGWIPVSPLPVPRSYAGAAAPPDGMIYVIGGQYYGTVWTGAVDAYDPGTDTWTPKTPMPTLRGGCAVALVTAAGASTVYVVGGRRDPDGGLTENAAYYPLTDTWAARAPLPVPRRWCAGAALGGTVYVIGGVWSGTITGRMDAYYPGTNTWAKALPAPMPTPRFLLSVVPLNGKLYAIGGFTALFGGSSQNNVKIEYLGTVEVYDPATNSWSPAASMPTPRGAAGAAIPGNGMIYVAGGLTAAGSTAAVERYDPARNRWDARAPLLRPTGPPDGLRHGLVIAAPWSSTILFAAGGETSLAGYPAPTSPPATFDATGLWATSGTIWADHEKYERSPAGFTTTLRPVPPAVEIGQSVTVWLDVTNSGDATATTFTAAIEITAGAGALLPVSGPFTGSGFLSGLRPGEGMSYGWLYTAAAPGLVSLSATVTGVDVEWGLTPTGAAFNDAPVTCAYPVRLAASLSLGPLPLVAGQVLTVTLTVSNTGGGTAYDVASTIALGPPGAPLGIIAGPPLTSTLILSPWISGTVIILPLSSTSFTWTFSVTGNGFAVLSAGATGIDPLFGALSATAMRSTQPSAPRGFEALPRDGAVTLRWLGNPAYEAVSAYLIYRGPPGGPLTQVAATSNTWFDDSGLLNGVTYAYRIVAVNADGTGPPSATVTAMPVQISDQPGDVRVSSSGPSPLCANPGRGEVVRFFVNVPAGTGTLRAAIYTLAGEEVRLLADGPEPPGKRILEWDGRNGKARIVATGGYYAVFEMPNGRRVVRKAAIVK